MKPSPPRLVSIRPYTRRLGATALLFATLAVTARADVAFAWSEALAGFSTTSPLSLVPHLEARVFAMTHLAMDEAIAETARGDFSATARLGAQRAAVASAAQTILAELLPAGASRFDALAVAQLAAIPDGADKVRAIRVGRNAAALVLSKRDRDGWLEITALNPPDGPSPDRSPAAAAALLNGSPPLASPWLDAKPFILRSARQIEAAPPYTLSREGRVIVDFTLRNAKIFAGVDRAAAATAAERNWAGRPFATWNRIARNAAERASLDLAGEARLLAVLNLALADATLAVLHWRHELGTWRATTVELFNPLNGREPMSIDELAAVDAGLRTEMVRRDLQQVLLPPLPDFPAPVATLAGAAQAIITGMLKSDRTPVVLPEADTAVATAARPPRVLASVASAARECAFVASLDGRHTREACVAGYQLGTEIGAYITKRAAVRR